MQENISHDNDSTDISLFVRIYVFISIISFCINFVLLYNYLFPHHDVTYLPKKIRDEIKIDTKEFRTGIFLPVTDENTRAAYYIRRDSLYQTEVDALNNYEYKFKVKWLDNTEYEIEFMSSNDSHINFKTGDKFDVKIMSGGNNYYNAIVRGRHKENVVIMYKIIANEYFLRPNQALKLTE